MCPCYSVELRHYFRKATLAEALCHLEAVPLRILQVIFGKEYNFGIFRDNQKLKESFFKLISEKYSYISVFVLEAKFYIHILLAGPLV